MLKKIDGYKIYIIAAVGILSAITQYWADNIDVVAMWEAIMVCLTAMGFRSTLQKLINK